MQKEQKLWVGLEAEFGLKEILVQSDAISLEGGWNEKGGLEVRGIDVGGTNNYGEEDNVSGE